MNIHEYQAKELLLSHGVNIQKGYVTDSADEAGELAKQLQEETGTQVWVIKAQIHAGGRGKGGGVKLAKSIDEVKEISDTMLGMNLVTKQTGAEGKLVRKILVAEDVYYPGASEIEEFYMSVLLNRTSGKNIIMYSTEGGMDIEAVAAKTPERIHKEEIDPSVGIMPYQLRNICFNLKLSKEASKNMIQFVKSLYDAYIKTDSSLFEINPVLKASDDKILAVDAKVSLDDNALFRHKDLQEMRDTHEEDPTEVEAGKYELNYVKLDGNVGCMVNGAGLAMATMDMIKISGGSPANFLDVGGTANAERVEQAFRIILSDKNVKAILVNIFGGIVRCDRVAKGIVDAYNNIGNISVPIIVRLQGTNAEPAKKLIEQSGLKVESAIFLKEAAEKVKAVVA